MNIVIVTLLLLQVKHFVFDFPMQTEIHVEYKGQYGHIAGIEHSFLHAAGTTAALCFLFGMPAVLFGLLDGILHYHIDWFKMNYGCSDMKDKRFWTDLGLDQLSHQLCYLLYIYLLV